MNRNYAAIAIVVLGCGNEPAEKTGTATKPITVVKPPASPPKPAPDPTLALAVEMPPKLPSALADWMPTGAHDAWQGAWMISLNSSDTGHWPSAIEIRDHLAIWDDGREYTANHFAVATPCMARFAHPHSANSSRSYDKTFLVVAGQLMIGGGDSAVGMRRDRSAIVCTNRGTVTLDASGACRLWEYNFERWESVPLRCRWSTKELLSITMKDILGKESETIELSAVGADLLQSAQFRDDQTERPYRRFADFAAAQTAAAAARKPLDPAEKAKVAGGRVGDLTSVNGLQATWGEDRSLRGKRLKLTAILVGKGGAQSGDLTTYNYTVADASQPAEPSLLCITQHAAPTLELGDRVTVEGSVVEFFREVAFEGCSIAAVQRDR